MKTKNEGTPAILYYSNSPSNARDVGWGAAKWIDLDMLGTNRSDF